MAEECKRIARPLGGNGKRGENSLLTLAKIVRAIASGKIRKHLEARETEIMVTHPIHVSASAFHVIQKCCLFTIQERSSLYRKGLQVLQVSLKPEL